MNPEFCQRVNSTWIDVLNQFFFHDHLPAIRTDTTPNVFLLHFIHSFSKIPEEPKIKLKKNRKGNF